MSAHPHRAATAPLAGVDLPDAGTLGASRDASVRMSAAPPRKDDGPGVGSTEAAELSNVCTPIVSVQADERNAQSTLAALLALRGFSLHELAGGGFLVARWDRTLHCSDLAGVRAFYGRLGGAA